MKVRVCARLRPKLGPQLLFLVFLGTGVALAAPRPATEAPEPRLALASPSDNERVEAGSSTLEVRAARSMRDISIVLARHAFDPSDWKAVQQGSNWIVVPYRGLPLRIAALGLPARIETGYWWAAVGRDARSGQFLSSEVGRFTLVPEFSNRVAPRPHIPQTAKGSLPGETRTAQSGVSRPIQLASGYTLLPDGPLPRVPADLDAVDDSSLAPNKSGTGRGAFLVRLGETPPDAARQHIQRAGGTVIATLSDDVYLVRVDASHRGRLTTDLAPAWVETLRPAFKLSPQIDRSAPGRMALTALVYPDGDAAAVGARLQALGATAVVVNANGINQLVRFEIEAGGVAAAAALADVHWIEPTPRHVISNDQAQWVVQTSIPESRRVWDAGLRGQGQVVMISDTGIRTNHEMFFDSTLDITDFGDFPMHRKIIAYTRGSDHRLVEFGDDAGSQYHGTHTTGTLAGNNDPTTTNPLDGMAKDARLYFADLGGPNSRGSIATPSDLNDLFLPSYVGNSGGAARIASNSWGAPSQGAYTLSSMQVDQFMWDHPDYLILFANGNNFATSSVNSPATAKNCLSVGGTGNGAARTSLYAATSRGPTRDLRRKPTISAPGELVASSVGTTRYAYSSYSGTSMATPAAAGALALLRQYLTEGWYPTGVPVAANAMTPSAALLKAMAVNSGENDVAPARVPDNNVGWGRINIDNVLYFPGDQRRTLLIDATDGLQHREFVEYQVQVTDPGQPFSVSLCWTDVPGNPIVVQQLVNDLDLVVTNGVLTYLGNRMFNGVSLVGAGRDSLNVEECVRVPTPTAGLWTVRVEGHRIGVGPQPFALCISGGVGHDAGSIALDRYEYALDDTLEFEVQDVDVSGSVGVTVSCPTDPWGETVSLTGADGVFHGSVVLTPTAPNPFDRRLAVSAGDVVTVTYVDASPSFSITATGRVQGLAPVVTDVQAQALSPSAVQINWATDIPATSRVRYGENGVLGSMQETTGYTIQHAVRLTGLRPGRTYRYAVESSSRTGNFVRDDFGGLHRTFTTKTPGRIALVLNGSSQRVLDTWLNAVNALGWDVDVFRGPDADPPLVGNRSVGLRSYSCVLWQVDADAYPPISDAQRTAIDSLLEGGGRLLVTGHDIGYGLADASVFSYTPERELWLERGLKTRYYYDELTGISTLNGVSGDPTSGGFVGGIAYFQIRAGSTSDLVGVAPGTDGVGSVSWRLDGTSPWPCGLRWESDAGKGRSLDAFWGGQRSRLVAMYFEWAGLASSNAAPAPARTDVLANSVDWLLGRRPPSVTLTAPAAGSVVTADLVPIRYSIVPESGRTIAHQSISYSLDRGASWTLAYSGAASDSVYWWDLGGVPVANSTQAMLRVVATDDGLPALSGQNVTNAVFTIARPDGDRQGPVLVAGSLHTQPTPVRVTSPATLSARFSDTSTGGGDVTAAEYSQGESAAAAGTGIPMNLALPASTAVATILLEPNTLPQGVEMLWVRARDAAGNWGPASGLRVVINAQERTDVGEVPRTTFVDAATPNPFRDVTSIRYGLAESGEVRLELFDVRGRRVRTLASGRSLAGNHSVNWDGRDAAGIRVPSGVFFARLTTTAGTYDRRLVLLH